jgi:ABC-type protease/lipase transport system fused ATPase/permease subunit
LLLAKSIFTFDFICKFCDARISHAFDLFIERMIIRHFVNISSQKQKSTIESAHCQDLQSARNILMATKGTAFINVTELKQ